MGTSPTDPTANLDLVESREKRLEQQRKRRDELNYKCAVELLHALPIVGPGNWNQNYKAVAELLGMEVSEEHQEGQYPAKDAKQGQFDGWDNAWLTMPGYWFNDENQKRLFHMKCKALGGLAPGSITVLAFNRDLAVYTILERAFYHFIPNRKPHWSADHPECLKFFEQLYAEIASDLYQYGDSVLFLESGE